MAPVGHVSVNAQVVGHFCDLHVCSFGADLSYGSDLKTEMGKQMSRTTTRVAAGTVIATMGFFWTAPLFNTLAVADPSVTPGGIPCLSILQGVATNPPDLSQGIPPSAASILTPRAPVVGGPVPPASAAGAVPIPPASVPGAPGMPAAGGLPIPPASTPGAPGTGAAGAVPTPPAALLGTPPAGGGGGVVTPPAGLPPTPPAGAGGGIPGVPAALPGTPPAAAAGGLPAPGAAIPGPAAAAAAPIAEASGIPGAEAAAGVVGGGELGAGAEGAGTIGEGVGAGAGPVLVVVRRSPTPAVSPVTAVPPSDRLPGLRWGPVSPVPTHWCRPRRSLTPLLFRPPRPSAFPVSRPVAEPGSPRVRPPVSPAFRRAARSLRPRPRLPSFPAALSPVRPLFLLSRRQ